MNTVEVRVEKKRWFVLAAYCLLSLSVAPISTCFTGISKTLQLYYKVEPIYIHLQLGIFGVAVVVFSLPASYILHKFGLATILKISACLNLIGGITRYFADGQVNGFILLTIGNFFTALSLASYMFLPATIAQNWFSQNERGKAIGIGLGFDMLSVGAGFLHSTSIIGNSKDINVIKTGLRSLFLHQLVISIVSFLIMLFVKSKPKDIPSSKLEMTAVSETTETEVQLIHKENIVSAECEKPLFWKWIKYLLKHRSFLLIVHMASITLALEITYEMILNDLMISLFPGKEKQLGFVGFTAVIMGFISNIIAGLILDKTKAYLKVTRFIFSLSLIFLIILTVLLEFYHSFVVIAIVFCCFAGTSTGYFAVSSIHLVVVTYPVDPGPSNMMLLVIQNFYATFLAFALSYVLIYIQVLYVNLTNIAIILGALFLSYFINKNPNNESTGLSIA